MFKRLTGRWQALPVRVRGSAIIAIPIVCLVTSLSAVAWLKMSLTEDEMWVSHTQVVRLESKRLLKALIDAETGMRGYGLTQREEFLEPYEQALAVIPRSLTRLENLVQDNPAQVDQIQVIRDQVNETLTLLDQKVSLQRELKRVRGQAAAVVAVVELYDWLNEGKAAMDATRREIDRFAAVEEQLLTQRQAHQNHYRQITWRVLWISGALGLLGTVFAIHLFWQLERELASQAAQLQDSNRQLTAAYTQLERFTANASHELRTPLAAILSNAQVGLMDWAEWEAGEPPPASIQQRLTKIVTLTKRMSELVRQLLWLARQEGNRTNHSPFGPIDLQPWLRQWASEGQQQARAAGLAFRVELPDATLKVCADGALLGQAIANLITNACRYTSAPGTVTLHAIVRATHIVLQVSDTGQGIPAAALPHVCEQFYRVNPSGSAAGFGLGLAITQHIVKVHGGTLHIESELGLGTTVAIALPRLSS